MRDTNTWFGESWGAAICHPDSHVETPVGRSCFHCDEVLVAGDSGVIILPDNPAHVECFLRLIVGSVGHLTGQCSCVKGRGAGCGDPEGMTIRQAAKAAWDIHRRMYCSKPEDDPQPIIVNA